VWGDADSPEPCRAGEASGVERQGLLVEFGRFDGCGRPLDPQSNEVRGRDRAAAHRAGLAVDVATVIEKGRLAVPMAMEGERDAGAQVPPEAIGVAGALAEHEARGVGIDADQAQDRAPGDELPAEAAEMAGLEVRIATAGHGLIRG